MGHIAAVIGLGGMGTWHVQNIQKKVPQLTVKGAFDIRQEALEKTKTLGIKAYSSLEEVLADPEIDLVTIAIPNDMHKETAIKALRAGKNVVCEKPVTLNAKEMEEIIAVMSGPFFLSPSLASMPPSRRPLNMPSSLTPIRMQSTVE